FLERTLLSKRQPLSVSETQQRLADDETLIIFDFDTKSYAWILTKDEAAWIELKISAADLRGQVKQLRSSLHWEPGSNFDSELAYQIYNETFGAFARKLPLKPRLSVVTNGALANLPLHMLITKDPSGKIP